MVTPVSPPIFAYFGIGLEMAAFLSIIRWLVTNFPDLWSLKMRENTNFVKNLSDVEILIEYL